MDLSRFRQEQAQQLATALLAGMIDQKELIDEATIRKIIADMDRILMACLTHEKRAATAARFFIRCVTI